MELKSTHVYTTQSMDRAVDYYKNQIAEADDMIALTKRVIETTSHGDDTVEALGFWKGLKCAYQVALRLALEARQSALEEA
jgi:hypothetical protein